jgi:hypothetical protein
LILALKDEPQGVLSMPDWMLEALKQSPTLAVCLGVVYFAWKHNQGIHNRYLESLEKSHNNHLSSKDAEIQHLRDDLDAARKERDKLLKALTAAKEKQ